MPIVLSGFWPHLQSIWRYWGKFLILPYIKCLEDTVSTSLSIFDMKFYALLPATVWTETIICYLAFLTVIQTEISAVFALNMQDYVEKLDDKFDL